MCSIAIRKVESKDSAFLCALMNHPALMHRLHQTATTNKDWTEAIQLWFQDEDEQDYILCDRDWPIGWFGVNGLQATDKKAYLKIAVLLPEYQGKGIGSSFLSDLLVELKAAGYSAVGLFVDCDNPQAQRCYQKCGFEIVDAQECSWPDGSVIRQYEMEKRF